MNQESRIKKNNQLLKQNSNSEFGFGTTSNTDGQRILNKDGSANINRLGEPRFSLVNIYHTLISISWWKFSLLVLSFYLSFNLLFTLAYYFICPDDIAGMIYNNEREKFMEIFFFSSQSLTTVGYGRLNPTGIIASSIAGLESMIGLMGFAMATGLLYGRFSRPTAKLLYSENIIIAPYTHPTLSVSAPTALMFRIANARRNQLIEVESLILFSFNETEDGNTRRKFATLNLEVSKISFLAMSWTIVHPINEESPLKDLSAQDMQDLDVEFLVSIKAIDDTYSQQIFARNSYKWTELKFDSKFTTILSKSNHGKTNIDLRKLSATEKY